ncbi:hypothetical protein [Metabacillus hrfriensis]|uniref:Uncharacterized protein n=1 Tax=Metabacillus hrfriensis TaxID=3048891 RepID=A0ACD4RHP4_9BACI|nr:hypothetical protein [Metabacillus sp. CT-WN-B3]WHZ60028.1 hypothetical protein QLQ22_12140 [Metabacillus sp. CT-WN-B3]
MKKITLLEAVEMYGTDAQKKCIAEGKKWRKESDDALMKEINRYYYSVKVDEGYGKKKGKKKELILGEKREVPLEKERNLGGNISNGKWTTPYLRNMDIMVVSVLEQGLITEVAQTLNQWCLDFELITPSMNELVKARYNTELKEKHVKDLISNNVIRTGEERVINDFILGLKTLQEQLAGTLNRMAKLKIIEYYPVYKGVVEGEFEPINLHESTVKKIVNLKREIMEKYDVNEWYLEKYNNAKKSKKYQTEWKKRLGEISDENGKVLSLRFYYVAYAIILKARKKKIISYLEQFNKDAIEQFQNNQSLFLNQNRVNYHSERNNHVVDEASKEQEKFLEMKVKKHLEELGGKSKRPVKEDYTYDSDYYSLYFDKLYAQRIKELQEYYGYTFK